MSTVELPPVSRLNIRIKVVMGVSGSGKSTIAEKLATVLGATYLDADDFHPSENVVKMAHGEALTDKDRWPWLKSFAQTMAQQEGMVIGACSALKRSYRECINQAAGESVLFIYLDGDKQLIRRRMAERENHFMPESLLESQFAALERPTPTERALMVDIQGSVDQVVDLILAKLGGADT